MPPPTCCQQHAAPPLKVQGAPGDVAPLWTNNALLSYIFSSDSQISCVLLFFVEPRRSLARSSKRQKNIQSINILVPLGACQPLLPPHTHPSIQATHPPPISAADITVRCVQDCCKHGAMCDAPQMLCVVLAPPHPHLMHSALCSAATWLPALAATLLASVEHDHGAWWCIGSPLKALPP